MRRKRDLEAERQRRIEALRKPRVRLAGAAATFSDHARKALESANWDADRVEWMRVEVDAIREAMAKNGQSASDTARAINEHSPHRADPASHAQVNQVIERHAPQLMAEYEQQQHRQRTRPGISR